MKIIIISLISLILSIPTLAAPCTSSDISNKSKSYDWQNLFNIKIEGQITGQTHVCFNSDRVEEISRIALDTEFAVKYYEINELLIKKPLLHQKDLDFISRLFVKNAAIFSLKLNKVLENQEKRLTDYELSIFFLRDLRKSANEKKETKRVNFTVRLYWDNGQIAAKAKINGSDIYFKTFEIVIKSKSIYRLNFVRGRHTVLSLDPRLI